MKFIKMLAALLGLAVVFKFVMDNPEKVTVQFYKYISPEIPLFLLLITTFVLGMVFASFASTLKILQLKKQLRQVGAAEPVKKEKKKKKNEEDVEPAPTMTADVPTATAEVAAAEVVKPVAEEVVEPEMAPESVELNSDEPPSVIELPAEPIQAVASDPLEEKKADSASDR
ncbi:MAG: DUF1049 domain-containing protein [Desulfuromonadaceae bacterium]|nr:DUF1049 domain-containing protein [Desulfuromonadaceae bacterium]